MRSRAARRTAAVAAVVVLLGAWWLTLAPGLLGGPATWLVVDGPSMRPTYDSGDLLVVRERADYRIGDAVAFDFGGGRVVHRLVGGDAERGWQTQGDGKPDPDGWTVPDADVLGVQLLLVPGGGAATAWARTPLGAAAVATALALFCTTSSSRRRRRRPPLTGPDDMTDPAPLPWRPRVPHPVEPALLAVAGLVATGGGLALGLGPLVPSGSSTLTALGIALLAVGLVIGAPLAGRVLLAWGGDEADKAVARLRRSSLLRVAAVPVVPTVHVQELADLRRVADLHGTPVLHVVELAGGHRFVVLAGGAAYELRLGEDPRPGPAEPRQLVDLVELESLVELASTPARTWDRIPGVR